MSALSYRGTVHFNQGTDASALPQHLGDSLRRGAADGVEVSAGRVSFKRAAIWPQFGYGDLTIDANARAVEYSLNFRRLLVFATVLMAISLLVAMELMTSGPLKVLHWFLIGWFLLVYAGLVLGIARFRGFLREAIACAPPVWHTTAAESATGSPPKIHVQPAGEHANKAALLENELLRLQNESQAEEKLRGGHIVRLCVSCPHDPLEAVAGAKTVLKALDRAVLAGWPEQQVSPSLPAWFIAACAPEQSRQHAEEWLAWWSTLTPEQQIKAEEEKDWSLENWLYWMEPQNRDWFWWDAVVEHSPERIIVQLEVTRWPCSWGALRWLLRTAGASAVELQNTA